MKNSITLGVTAGRKYENYFRWLSGENITVIRLGHDENSFSQIRQCDGVVLSGGEDVHPRFYRHPEYVSEFHLDDIDEKRDDFELEVLSYADHHGLPILGICRGLQIANVYFGGTLMPDIVSRGFPDHTKFQEGKDRYHSISVIASSRLRKIAGVTNGEVNSAHHQAVDITAPVLRVSALSADGVIEALEKAEEGKPYRTFVQWHPERMQDQSSPLSMGIRTSFISAVMEKENQLS